jgi:hypothetical protein
MVFREPLFLGSLEALLQPRRGPPKFSNQPLHLTKQCRPDERGLKAFFAGVERYRSASRETADVLAPTQ